MEWEFLKGEDGSFFFLQETLVVHFETLFLKQLRRNATSKANTLISKRCLVTCVSVWSSTVWISELVKRGATSKARGWFQKITFWWVWVCVANAAEAIIHFEEKQPRDLLLPFLLHPPLLSKLNKNSLANKTICFWKCNAKTTVKTNSKISTLIENCSQNIFLIVTSHINACRLKSYTRFEL